MSIDLLRIYGEIALPAMFAKALTEFLEGLAHEFGEMLAIAETVEADPGAAEIVSRFRERHNEFVKLQKEILGLINKKSGFIRLGLTHKEFNGMLKALEAMERSARIYREHFNRRLAREGSPEKTKPEVKPYIIPDVAPPYKEIGIGTAIGVLIVAGVAIYAWRKAT